MCIRDRYNALLLSGKLWTYLADLNEQAADRLACIVSQMQKAEAVTEELKAREDVYKRQLQHRPLPQSFCNQLGFMGRRL